MILSIGIDILMHIFIKMQALNETIYCATSINKWPSN